MKLWFSDELEPAFSTIRVIDAGGRRVDRNDVHVAHLLAANAWYLVGSPTALVDAHFGRLLLAKRVLFGAMVALAAHNRLRMSPRVDAHDPAADMAQMPTLAAAKPRGAVAHPGSASMP